MKRIIDIFASAFMLILLLPFGLVIALLIACDSRGGVFYRQSRVGRYNRDFTLYKFRTMRTDADRLGLLTVGARDPRVTRVGYYLRKYKIDELPQLLNILLGDMSFVGPRPEVRKYVDLYNNEQKKVLSVRPGLTDYASIAYINENEILEKANDKEQTYINEIMPEKIKLNMKFIQNPSLYQYFKIIFLTIKSIFI